MPGVAPKKSTWEPTGTAASTGLREVAQERATSLTVKLTQKAFVSHAFD